MGRNPKSDQAGSDIATIDQTQTPQSIPSQNGGNGNNAEAHFQASSQASGAQRAFTESEALARDLKEGTLSGFVGSGTVVTGEATFKAMLRIDGHLSGRVSSQGGTLIVSAGGQIDANVEVAVAVINGTVNGDVVASKRIELGRAAKVTGNIQTPALVIEQGAIFEGSCRMLHLKDEQNNQQLRAAEEEQPLVKNMPNLKEVAEPAALPELYEVAS